MKLQPLTGDQCKNTMCVCGRAAAHGLPRAASRLLPVTALVLRLQCLSCSGCIVTACLLQCLAVGVDALVLKMKHMEHICRFLLSRLAEVSCLLPLGVEQSCFTGACQCISLLKSPSPAAHPSHRHRSTTANIYKSLSPSLPGQTVMLVTLCLS